MKRDTVITLVIFYIAITLLDGFYFMVGYHNADVGQNMRWLNTRLGLDLYDTTLGGENLTAKEAYSVGMNSMYFGAGCLIAAGMVPFLYLVWCALREDTPYGTGANKPSEKKYHYNA